MRYFYFRFKKDFFTKKEIRNLKNIPVVGYQYIVIFLELCALATEEKGILIIPKMGEISYIDFLARNIGEHTDLTGQALTYFINNGLVEKRELENEVEFIFREVVNNCGTSTLKADSQRIKYNVGKLPEPTKVVEAEEVAEAEDTIKKPYGQFKNVMLTDKEYNHLVKSVCNLDKLIKDLDLDKAIGTTTLECDFEELKKRWKGEGI